MTFVESKTLLTPLLFGDIKVPDNNTLIVLYKVAFDYIVNECIPLKLVTKTNDFSTVRTVDIGDGVIRYIRRPRLPKVDGDTLDIDDELCNPLTYLVASYLSKAKPGDLYAQALEMISQYNFKVYNTRELLKDEQ